jgi:outer membrane lipoprotein
MESRISRDVSFSSIKSAPEQFSGRLVVVGGQVLNTKRLQEGTQVEVLQLPLDRSDRPVLNLMDTKGRFLALQPAFLDPAIIPPGSNVSFIAEVIGSKTLPLNETSYRYPMFLIKTFKVWLKAQSIGPRPFPFWDRWAYPFEDPWTHPYWGAY